MKSTVAILICAFILQSGCASGPYSASQTRSEAPSTYLQYIRYKQLYHEWQAAVYADSNILISSNYERFIQMSEFKRIVDMGEGILPFVVEDIREKVEGFYFLYYVIIAIKGWTHADLANYTKAYYPERALLRLIAESQELKAIWNQKWENEN